MITRLTILTLLLAVGTTLTAQRRVQLKQADVLRGRVVEKERVDWVIGHVIFEQNNTTIYCDSALFNKRKNSVRAFGKVRITDGDSVTITARVLEYDGESRLAKLRDNVVFTKLATATLYTDNLDYDRPAQMATYFSGGRLVDSINVLTSRKGYYNAADNMASFKRNVHVKNPDYDMRADSLQYNSRTKVIYFRTPTEVIDKDKNVANYEGGEYDTKTQKSNLERGIGETPSYRITGKNYFLDDILKVYKARENVIMTSKEESLNIYGQALDYDKRKEIAKVYSHAYLAKAVAEGDTLFLSADTLVALDSNNPAEKRLLAYRNVRIFKSDLQGVADSAEYRPQDSTFYFYHNPVLWSEGNQMTADTIYMYIENNTINEVYLHVNAFVISSDTLNDYNQIKGRNMTAQFRNGRLHRVIVDGNGESIYYAYDQKDKSFTGVNRISCSNITIRFIEGKVNNLTFYVNADANFIPPHEIKPDDTRLDGFDWKSALKPTREGVIQLDTVEQTAPNVPAY